ncbi:hypothetical protein, partial [Streptomyces sp. SM1]|uniref:hypothetical protein n=1 Tax=Streptomyces sp. SM1 TaxID=402229 RepID=UPI001CA565A2
AAAGGGAPCSCRPGEVAQPGVSGVPLRPPVPPQRHDCPQRVRERCPQGVGVCCPQGVRVCWP